jgi:hypothetical protein
MLGQGSALGVLEQAMRAALTTAGARLLEAVLAGDDDGYAGPHAGCGQGHQAGYAGRRAKTIATVLGPVRVTRAWYHCAGCGRGFAPRDQQLGVAGTSLSPGLTEMIARAGAEVPFGKAAALLAELAGVSVSARTVERSAEASGAATRAAGAAEAAALRARKVRPLPPGPVPDMLYVETDGTGVPMRPAETEGRQGKGEDGRAGTREIKLARFFTVSRLDDDGRPVMDPGSSSYVATFDGKDALAGLVEAEYLRRGGEHFRQVVAIGDGAAWIWTMAGALYPHATHITDIYHAREHLTDLANHLAFITPDPPQWLQDRNAELDAGDIEAIITAARQYPLSGVKAEELDRKLGYFERNAHRMRYAHFKKLGMFTGSGAIEGGIKAIVVQRAKQAGMHWTLDGAAGIIALRCQHASGRWDELWAASTTQPTGLRAAI